MIKLTPLISELKVTNLAGGGEDSYLLVVVYKGDLFLLDRNSKLDKLMAVVKDHPARV